MIAGPCVVCGRTNYELSMGGPTICPRCDCSPPTMRQIREREEKDQAVIAALRRERDELAAMLRRLLQRRDGPPGSLQDTWNRMNANDAEALLRRIDKAG